MLQVSQPVAHVQHTSRHCCRCGGATDGTTCNVCLRSDAEWEATKIQNDLRALVNGSGVFWCLGVEARAALLATMGFIPSQVAQLMDDAALIAVVADHRSSDAAVASATDELARRLGQVSEKWGQVFQNIGNSAPSPAERQQIEDEDEQYHRELTLQREAETEEFPRLA